MLLIFSWNRSGGYGSGYNCAAWFLTALFLVETIYVLLRSITIKTGLRGEYPILIALFALAVCMVQLSISGWSSKVSVMAIRTGYLLFWYECGYFYRTHLEKHLRKVNQWLVLLLAVAAAVVLQTFYEKGQDVRSVVFVAQFYPNIPFVFFRAALGIVFWLEISYITTPLLMKIKPVMYMADHTFSLMMHQGLAGVLINSVYRCIAPERCNDAEFTTQIWYNYPSRWEKLSYVLLVPCLVLGVVYLFQICRKQYEKRTEAARS